MVKGLDVFRTWFKDHSDQYVLIGGTAATLTMEDAGLAFWVFRSIVTGHSGLS